MRFNAAKKGQRLTRRTIEDYRYVPDRFIALLRYLATRPGMTPDEPLFPAKATGLALTPNGDC